MARTGTITLIEKTSQKTGKPYRALMLTVGTWTKLHFIDSSFEMDYIAKYLTDPESADEVTAKAKNTQGTSL